MNKKGFTTAELLVSFVLSSIIILFLFELIFVLKDLYVESGIRVKLLSKQATINTMINDDFKDKKVLIAAKCGDTCVNISFNDGITKQLSYNRDDKSISYGNYTTKLINGSKFGNINIKSETSVRTNDNNSLNGILNIEIPIYHDLIEKENFGVEITYLYNSNITSISGVDIVDVIDSTRQIYLIGSSSIGFKDMNYTDPGYYVLDTQTGIITDNDSSVVITGNVDTSTIGTYYITYTIYDMNNTVMDQKIRTVNVIDSEYTFDYTGDTETYDVPVNGIYQIELWGASGGGSDFLSGNGGYTIGKYALTKDDVLYINTGGKGLLSTDSSKASGGFNGGGDSSFATSSYAGSGGGASDVRLNNNNLDNRLFVAGGGGGAGSYYNSSNEYCSGGYGGGAIAGNGNQTTCATSYLGGGATSTEPGVAATYTTNMTLKPINGFLGNGGYGGKYDSGSVSYACGGGGGGYYGGGGGSRFGNGGGGSGYCSTNATICTTKAGNLSFPNPNTNGYETGHEGNGFIKITLMSITS